VPPWARDVKTGLTLFNWQAETAWQKTSFAEPLRRGRRCLVPCNGFFEFTGPKARKQPWLFTPRDGGLMAFAGLWAQWRGPDGAAPLLSFSIATCAPNATVAPIHDRMPVVLTGEAAWDAWLRPDAGAADLNALLQPAPDDLLQAVPVSRDLLRVKEPGPELLEPIALEEPG
jgi:putative SOS response-associated peptidase YedK